MTEPSNLAFAACAGVAFLVAASGAAAAPPVRLRLDAETTVNGVTAGCTGIGQTRHDPRWDAYSVRIEFSDSKGEYVSDEAAAVFTAKGEPVVAVSCPGPWILLKLPAGAYRVEGRLLHSPAKPRSAPVTAPRKGQVKVGLQFPDV